MRRRRCRSTTEEVFDPNQSGDYDGKEKFRTVELRRKSRKTESEAAVQSAIAEGLHKSGWMVVRINSGGHPSQSGRWLWNYNIVGFGHWGFPDLIAIRRTTSDVVAQILLVEVKRKKGAKLEQSQKLFRLLAQSMGIPVHICTDWNQVQKLITSITA